MKGMEKITARIDEEARAAADEIIAQAQAEASIIIADYEQQAAAAKSRILDEEKKKADENCDRKIRAVSLTAKKDILELKQHLIDDAYTLAERKLLAMPREQYADFLASLAAQAAVSGSEELIFNESDCAEIGELVTAKANALLEKKSLPGALTCSSATRPISGGLYIKSGSIEVNCSIAALIEDIRDEMDIKLSKLLFY